MNILLVSSEYPPESPGGLGNSVRNLALGLKACGAKPHVLSSRMSANKRPLEECDTGIPVTRIPRETRRWRRAPGWFWRFHPYYIPFDCYRYSRDAAEKCREIIRRKSIDVVQFADYRGEGFSFVGGAHSVPSVIRLATPLYLVEAINRHEAIPSIRERSARAPGAYELMKFLEQKPIREAQAVASPSRSLARLIEREVSPKGALRVIPTGIDLEHFSRKTEADIRDFKTSLDLGDKKFILCVGRYEYRKGVHDLIDAFARIHNRIPDHILICAGADTDTAPGGGSMKEYCVKHAAELEIENRVKLLDRVSYEVLPQLYSLASLFVVPSLYENLANTLLEALACGVPVISTTSGGAAEIIVDPANGTLIPPAEPRMLAEAILDLLSDPERCTIIGEANKNLARREFSRETMAQRFLDLYRSITS